MKRQEAPDLHLTCQQSGLLAGSLRVGWLVSKKSFPLLLPRGRLKRVGKTSLPFPSFPQGNRARSKLGIGERGSRMAPGSSSQAVNPVGRQYANP